MPYHKVGPNKYCSETKCINENQLKLWHAQGDHWPGEKKDKPHYKKVKKTKPKH